MENIVRDSDRDNYLTPEQAMEYGLVDEILGVNREAGESDSDSEASE